MFFFFICSVVGWRLVSALICAWYLFQCWTCAKRNSNFEWVEHPNKLDSLLFVYNVFGSSYLFLSLTHTLFLSLQFQVWCSFGHFFPVVIIFNRRSFAQIVANFPWQFFFAIRSIQCLFSLFFFSLSFNAVKCCFLRFFLHTVVSSDKCK